MFNNTRLTGIGELHFMGANQIILNDEFAGITIMYEAVHGGEDKYKTPNPADEENMRANYNAIFNNKD